MLFINIIRFFMGYVTFTARGGFTERFLNLCQKNKIVLWDIKSKGGVIYANTSIKNYKRIRESARRSSMKVRIYKKHGMPFIAYRHKNRVGFVAGFVAFLFIIGMLSTRLWTVDVKGNQNIPDKQIIAVFNELGVDAGTKISDIDVKKVQDVALTKLPDLTWLALNISGSTATIEVKERVKKPKIAENTPCNVVANYGGQIIKIEVYKGTKQQELGAAVAKGDLLVSGVVENLDMTSKLEHANALIIAKTERNLTSSQNRKIESKIYLKDKKRYKILFFGLKIPLFGFSEETDDNFQYYYHKHMLKGGNRVLPVGFIEEGYKIYEDKSVLLNEEQSKLLALENYCKNQNQTLKDSKLIGENIKIECNDNIVKISGKYKCEENIGQNKEIYLDN